MLRKDGRVGVSYDDKDRRDDFEGVAGWDLFGIVEFGVRGVIWPDVNGLTRSVETRRWFTPAGGWDTRGPVELGLPACLRMGLGAGGLSSSTM